MARLADSGRNRPRRARGAAADARELLAALVHGERLTTMVPLALESVERDPLASAGKFPGEILRGLMELPGEFWGRHPALYDRYRAALRAAAAIRRQLPPEERMRFWEPLDIPPRPGTERPQPRNSDSEEM